MAEFDFDDKKLYKPFSNKLDKISFLTLLKNILSKDLGFLYLAIIYSVFISILTLAVPLSVQLLINSILFTNLIQPIIVIGVILFILLCFSGLLNIFQTYLIEIFQRRFFARMSAETTMQIINSEFKALEKSNQGEFVNRFFDVFTIQKIVSRFITDSFSLILQIIFGFILVAFYHPALLFFNIFVIGSIFLIWKFFYRKATMNSFLESRRKYDLVGWIEEIAQNSNNFKSEIAQKYAKSKVDFLTKKYLEERKQHFKQLFTQIILLFSLYAVSSSLLLVFGGYLVIINKLSIGQLVASELVLTSILYQISKIGKDFENFYDLVTSCEKLSQFYNIPTVKHKSKTIEDAEINIKFENVEKTISSYNFKFDFEFKAQKNYFISTKSSLINSTLLDLLKSYDNADCGLIKLNNHNLEEINLQNLHSLISEIDNSEFIEGKIIEYLTFTNKLISKTELNNLCNKIGLTSSLKKHNINLETKIVLTGAPLNNDEKILLKIIKIIIDNPKIIILNEIFDLVKDFQKKNLIDFIKENSSATILYFSNNKNYSLEFDEYIFIDEAKSHHFSSIKELSEFEQNL